MPCSICRGCGKQRHASAIENGFCPACRAAFADKLLSRIEWMKEQIHTVYQKRDAAFAEFLIPTYRSVLNETQRLQSLMLYPEWLGETVLAAELELSKLESIRLRTMAEITAVTDTAEAALKELDAYLATQTKVTVSPEEVKRFHYYSQLLFSLYAENLLERRRDFDADRARVDTLLDGGDDEDYLQDGRFGPSPRAVIQTIGRKAFGNKKEP